MAQLKVGKKFKLNGDTVQVVSINADGTATLNYAAGSGRTGFAGKVALNVGSKSATASAVDTFDADDIEVDDAIVTLDSYNDYDEKPSVPAYDSAAFDSNVFNNYEKKGKRVFTLGLGGSFTDSKDYSKAALDKIGFNEEHYEQVNRPNVDGKPASEDLKKMRTAFLAATLEHEQAVKEFKEVKTPLFANDYDKYKPRFEAMFKAEDAARRAEFYAEMVNRAEAEGKKYKTTGSLTISQKSDVFMDKKNYKYIDGGVPIYRDLPELKWAQKVENEHYVFMTDKRVTDLFDNKKVTDGWTKARKEAYQAHRKDYEADFQDKIMDII